MSMVYKSIVYILAPAIMLSFLVLAIYITVKVSRESKISAIAGLCLGLIFFATYVWSSFSSFERSTVALGLPAFGWLPTVVGSIVGFGLLLLGRILEIARSALAGLLILFLTATSSSAIFSYYFSSLSRSESIDLGLGGIFGILIYIVLFPDAIRGMIR
jgi:hypothetical protein